MIKYFVFIVMAVFFFLNSAAFSKIENQKIIKHTDKSAEIIIYPEKNKYSITEKNNLRIIDFYENTDFSKPGTYNIPTELFYIAIPPESKIRLSILSQKSELYENASPAIVPEMTLNRDSSFAYKSFANPVQVSESSQSVIEVAGYTYIRDFYCAVIKVNKFLYNMSTSSLTFYPEIRIKLDFEKIIPFTQSKSPLSQFDNDLINIISNFKEAQSFRVDKKYFPNETKSDSWIDYSKNHIKLAVPYDGIYRIFYSDLVTYGIIPSSIDPRTIKFYLKGVEKPVYISGETDGQFNANDYIEFYGQSNYDSLGYRNIVSTGQDYINYMNRYTDTTFIWMTWGGTYGKRIFVQNQNITPTSDSIKTSLSRKHLEADQRLWYYDPTVPAIQLPFWQHNKVFTWTYFQNNTTLSIPASSADPIPNTSFKSTIRMISNASNSTLNAHKITFAVNSNPSTDTIIFDYKKTVNFNITSSSNRLNNGTNTIKLSALNTQSSFYQVLVDWVDFEFFRYNKAKSDSIYIIVPDSVSTAIRVMYAEDFTVSDTSIIIYKITPSIKRIQNFTLSSGASKKLTFVDTISGGDRYLIIKNTSIKKPKFVTNKLFVNLRNSARGADYIVVTNKVLQTSATSYKNFISSKYGVRTEMVYVDDIYDEFAYGYLTSESIKSFLVSAYNNWLSPKPSYLLFIGDANYDYKDIWDPVPSTRKKNLVPSYGNPVSDPWFVWWDSSYASLQQMYVGRIPANSNSEVQSYLTKHQSYVNRTLDSWNKKFMLFSGGNTANASELAQIFSANKEVGDSVITPAPVGGKFVHFYKTKTPQSNYGPYTPQEVQNAIDQGGAFISYIGHSGTRTWDNGIIEVEHLQNEYADRFPLITDFGCSTGKFAEPDVDAFGELFIAQSQNGQAICYLGNTSWGYLTTSLRFPKIFYSKLLKDSLKNFGRIHAQAKGRLFSELGFNDVNRVFLFCNLLFGDPIIAFPTPDKPNFSISLAGIVPEKENPNDNEDSLKVNISFANLGLVFSDSLKIYITDKIKDSLVFSKTIYLKIPYNDTSLIISVPVKKRAGSHKLAVNLNSDRRISEISFDDNSAEIQYNVFPSSFLFLSTDAYYNSGVTKLSVINPLLPVESNVGLIYELADNEKFMNSTQYNKQFDTLVTSQSVSGLALNKRYFWRVKLNIVNSDWSETNSFINTSRNFNWYIDSTLRSKDFSSTTVQFDSTFKAWTLSEKKVNFKLISAGYMEGGFASLLYDYKETLPNTLLWGFATALIDTLTYKPYGFRAFEWPRPASGDSLISYLNSLPTGTLIAIAVSDDAVESVLGWGGSFAVRNKLKEFGSKYIDSVQYQESWAMIGKKGAATGTVPEVYKKLFQGTAVIELTKSIKLDTGYVEFPPVKNSSSWKYLNLTKDLPSNTKLSLYITGIKNDNSQDTVAVFDNLTSDSISLTGINATIYPQLKLNFRYVGNSSKQSPKIFNIGASYTPVAEFAINYQTVSVSKDSIYEGDKDTIRFFFQNVGGTASDSCRVLVNVQTSMNYTIPVLDTVFSSIGIGERKYLNVVYKSFSSDSPDVRLSGAGRFISTINIDKNNKNNEIHKSNNVYNQLFFVKKDTNQNSVTQYNCEVLADDEKILPGTYISQNPELKVHINYPVWFNPYDTTALIMSIDEGKVPWQSINSQIDSNARTIDLLYRATLTKGEHILSLKGKNVFGKIDEQSGFQVIFKVSNDLKISEVYNIPNPFTDVTDFTFNATQRPDEVKIRIYTIAGRLVKEIVKPKEDLNINLNVIHWDGKDNDGDVIGNGVYLYKIIMKKGDKAETAVQKLVKVK